LSIIDEIQSGNHPSRIASSMGLSKQSLNYYIRKLKSEGIIEKKGYGVWEVKKEVKEFSLGTRPTTNLHALQINFPILKGKIMDSEWQLKEKLNNWIPKYKENINTLGGLTFKNNNNKSLTVFVHSRDISSIDEVDNLAFKVRAYVFDYFRKEGVTLDVMNCKTTNLNLATQDKEIKPLLRKGEKYELDLHKKAEPIFQQDNINAKAWLDNSPKPGSAETNDKEWKREYLNMPFRIKEMFDIIEAQLKLLEVQTRSTSALAENIKSHIPSWMSNRKVEIELRKLNRRLSERQTTLTKD
jgi:DNA-binding Lrp family transcriptional regulator